MLAPCACDGSAKWVHRVCLARWRKTATNVISKVQCEVCHSYYRLSRSSGRRYGLEAHLTLGGATVVCEIFLVLYYMLLTYVVGFATRVAANLLPANLLILPELPDSLPTPTATPTGGSLTEGMFDDQILQSSATVLLLAVKFLFAVFQLVNRLRMTWNHLPLSFFMLGAYNRLTDRAIFTSGAAMCLASFATGVLWPARILGDVLWCFSVAWAFPLLWQDTKRRARMIAPRLLLLLVEVGDRGEEEVLNHDD
ncbi:hypothetical protein DFJ74DRAFT_657951 [Hyaloraphidium curvatum]|nr:hypothetical protein DFJ74DRAFT_657951 [Hyaloraphidium curvatum]